MENTNIETQANAKEDFLENQETIPDLKEIVGELKELTEEFSAAIDAAEKENADLDKNDPEKFTLFDKLRKKGGKIIVMTGLLLNLIGGLNNKASANENFDLDKELNKLNNTEITSENSMEGGDDVHTGGFKSEDNNPEEGQGEETKSEEETTGNQEEGSIEENLETHIEKVEFDMTTSFELGNAVINEAEQEKMQSSITNFFDNLPQEIKDRINNGESVISINSGCSPELIAKTGIESGRGIVHNNIELATERANEGFEKVVEPSLNESGLNSGKVIYTIPENGVDNDNPIRYVTISIEDKIEVLNDLKIELKEGGDVEIEIEKILSNTYGVIIDESPSMEKDAKEVRSLINEINENSKEEVREFKLDAGFDRMHEQHLKTIDGILDGIEEPLLEKKYLIIYSDEPDVNSEIEKNNQISDYENKLQETIDRSKDLNIEIVLRAFDPSNSGESILKSLESNDLTRTNNQSVDKVWFKNLSS